MPSLSATQTRALEHWRNLGPSLINNPVVMMAYVLYWKPCGINADDFSYDALAALQDPTLIPTFTNPVFDDTLVDAAWSQYPTIAPLLKIHKWIEPVIEADGVITEYEIIQEYASGVETNNSMIDTFLAEIPEALQDRFIEKRSPAITELTENLRDCSKQFIDQSLTLLLTNPMADERCNLFLTDPAQYAAAAFQALSQS